MPIPKNPKNHYETLGLEKNCNGKEVKNAFLELSKAHHPDLNPHDPSHKEKFVQIYEAYSVLSKPEKRHAYDSELLFKERMKQSRSFSSTKYDDEYRVETDAPNYRVWRDETIWSMRDKTKEDFSRDKPYYGIKGVNRVSNYWIAGGAVLLMLLGTMFHYAAFKYSKAFTTTQLDRRDEITSSNLFVARLNARRNGNDMQLRFMQEKLQENNRNEIQDDE